MRKTTRKPTKHGVRWTLESASAEWGVSKDGLRRWLRSAETVPGDDERYSTLQIDRAIHSDIKAERLRKIQLENELLTIEKAQKNRDSISLEEALATVANSLAPVRQKLLALPAEMASRCNPIDPDLARAALEQWRDGALRFCREVTETKTK